MASTSNSSEWRRLLIVGWDGAGWDYIDPLLAAGRLPHLQRLLRQGASATLRSTIPPYTNVAWPSLVTGLSPAQTGVFGGARTRPGSYELVPTNLAGYHGIPIWRWANHYARRVGILNVPMTYPAEPVEGFLISGFDSPADSHRIAYPEGILDRWATSGHPYRLLEDEIALMSSQNPHQPRGDLDTFVSRWIRLTLDQGEYAARLWQEEAIDLLFVVFSATDSINHRTNLQEHIASVYEAADAALGRLLANAGSDTVVTLVSDHGSTPAHRYLSLYTILHDAGWLHFRPEIAPRYWRRLPGQIGRLLVRRWFKLPRFIRQLLSWPALRLDPRFAIGYGNIDWSRTQVCARSGMGPLYINKAGREPEGTVTESEYETFRDKVIAHLLALHDDDGRPLFTSVQRGEHVYPHATSPEVLPDLVFTPARWTDHPITGFPQDPSIRPIPPTREYGTHTRDGIAVFAGPGIKAGSTLDTVAIEDVVPTVLAAWGLPLPAGLDGQVLQDVFVQARPVMTVPAPQSLSTTTLKEVDQSEEVMARLRALGYVE